VLSLTSVLVSVRFLISFCSRQVSLSGVGLHRRSDLFFEVELLVVRRVHRSVYPRFSARGRVSRSVSRTRAIAAQDFSALSFFWRPKSHQRFVFPLQLYSHRSNPVGSRSVPVASFSVLIFATRSVPAAGVPAQDSFSGLVFPPSPVFIRLGRTQFPLSSGLVSSAAYSSFRGARRCRQESSRSCSDFVVPKVSPRELTVLFRFCSHRMIRAPVLFFSARHRVPAIFLRAVESEPRIWFPLGDFRCRPSSFLFGLRSNFRLQESFVLAVGACVGFHGGFSRMY
jgi:hypothetical protein